MRILVTGSRDWPYPEVVFNELDRATRGWQNSEIVIVHGACPTGADSFAHAWAVDLPVNTEAHPADWAKYGKAAGPTRNQEMVDLGADFCLAFSLNQSKGTADCLNRAVSRGIPCRIFDLRVSG